MTGSVAWIMQLGDLLTAERIRPRLTATSLPEACALLLADRDGAAPSTEAMEALLRRLSGGEGGLLRRVSSVTLIVSIRSADEDGPRAGLAVALKPLELPDPGEDGEVGPRVVLLLKTPRSAGIQGGTLDGLARVLRDASVESRLLAASDPNDVLAIARLMDVGLNQPLRVEHVLVPLAYRVFPDTPLAEVVDLMARKGLQALPVVGEDLRVVGVVTAGEALKHALQRRGRGKEESSQRPMGSARDIMSRAVMCVSEDQDLLDAAQLMINKEVGQLPVVREGEIVGILTRDAVLGALFGGR